MLSEPTNDAKSNPIEERRVLPRMSSTGPTTSSLKSVPASLLLGSLLLWLVAIELSLGLCIQEDTFISFRYARNLVDGHGLLFNPGELPVEGYTNFLWTVMIAGAMKLGLDPVSFVRFMGMGLSLILVVAVFFLARREFRLSAEQTKRSMSSPADAVSSSHWLQWPAGLLAAGVLAVSPSVAAESVQGLETICFTLLVTLAVGWQAEARRREAAREPGASQGYFGGAFLLGLAALTRPEGVLVAGLVTLAGIAWRRQRGGPWLTVLEFTSGLFFVAIFLPYWFWRFSYYGYPFPNTFYAKTGGGLEAALRGMRYLGSFLAANPGLTLLTLLAVGAGLIRLGWQTGRSWRIPSRVLNSGDDAPPVQPLSALNALALTIVLGYGSYVVAVGGDFKSTFRFVMPFLPLWVIVLDGFWLRFFRQEPSGQARAGFRRWLRPATYWTLLFLVIFGGLVSLPETVEWSRARAIELFYRTSLGQHLAEFAPPGAVLAIHSAGIIPYYSGLRTIDMWGLNDLHIAHLEMPKMGQGTAGHEKNDIGYVFSRRPHYFVPEGFFVTLQPVRDVAAVSFSGTAVTLLQKEFMTRNVPVRLGQGDNGKVVWFNFLERRPEK